MNLNLPKLPQHEPQSRNALRGGSYSLAISAIVLAILIAVNVFVSALPKSMTKYDISASKLYSITSNTKVVVNNLTQDVTIYWIVQSGEEDDVIENLLSKYESLSEHIKVIKKNPDVYPTFAKQYTSETVANNSLIVESGEKSRYIAYSDIYLNASSMYSYSYSTSFDGEGAITSAIDYVVSEEYPQVYLLEGHGEASLPDTLREQMEKDNIVTSTLSLLHADIPEDADCLLLYAPASDISEDERALLADYLSDGGKLMVVAGATQEDGILKNLYALLADYGVEAQEGIVIENDPTYYYAFSGPAALLPALQSCEITDSLISSNYSVLYPIALGLTVGDTPAGVTVTELLRSSVSSYSKRDGYAMTTYDYEDGDLDGPFSLAVSISTSSGGELVWFTSSYFLEDACNASSSGANGDLAMNALAELIGESEAMAIRSKSLNYDYLTISSSTASLLKVLMIGVFPLAYLALGAGVTLKRRRRQNEPV